MTHSGPGKSVTIGEALEGVPMLCVCSCTMTIDSAVDDLKTDDSLLEPFRERLLKLADEISGTSVRRICDDDHALCRLLLARLNNIDKAHSMAVDVLRWRSHRSSHRN
jgi:hypothetical protein